MAREDRLFLRSSPPPSQPDAPTQPESPAPLENELPIESLAPLGGESQSEDDMDSSLPLIGELWSRKRKAKTEGLRRPRDFKLSSEGKNDCERYRNLLDLTIVDVAAKIIWGPFDVSEDSYYGSSCWSAAEKLSFGDAVALNGKYAYRAISEHVRTKSPLEVQRYIEILEQLLNDTSVNDKLLSYSEFPAAFEVSEEACELLEETAESLREVENGLDQILAMDECGTYWIWDKKNVHSLSLALEKAEEVIRGQDGAEDEPIPPSALLLKPETMLQLSKHIFMNADPLSGLDNWRSLSRLDDSYERMPRPSMYATALEDFYTLVVAFTKRLVQATHFYAQSRIRSAKTMKPYISPRDVEAAASVCASRTETDHYWAEALVRNKVSLCLDKQGDPIHLSIEDLQAVICGSSNLEDLVETSNGLQHDPEKLASNRSRSNEPDPSVQGELGNSNALHQVLAIGDQSLEADDIPSIASDTDYETEDELIDALDQSASLDAEHEVLDLLCREHRTSKESKYSNNCSALKITHRTNGIATVHMAAEDVRSRSPEASARHLASLDFVADWELYDLASFGADEQARATESGEGSVDSLNGSAEDEWEA